MIKRLKNKLKMEGCTMGKRQPALVPDHSDLSPEVEMIGLQEYEREKMKYLRLCRKHGLNPFDLNILSMAVSRLPRKDKVNIVASIIKLIKLERRLKKSISGGLFPLTVKESERSGYLIPTNLEG
jgi:hypothetical protein